ncbi:unnamed protein product [Sphagnum balticum]
MPGIQNPIYQEIRTTLKELGVPACIEDLIVDYSKETALEPLDSDDAGRIIDNDANTDRLAAIVAMLSDPKADPESKAILFDRHPVKHLNFVFERMRTDGRTIHLENVNLSNKNLQNIKFNFVKLSGANLSGANLEHANLHKADLSEANLNCVCLHVAALTHTNLYRTRLVSADLSGADLCEANLAEADLAEGRLHLATLANANLTGANLAGAHLDRANLISANLSKANLSKADLSKANLSKADLSGATLTGANLRDTILHGTLPTDCDSEPKEEINPDHEKYGSAVKLDDDYYLTASAYAGYIAEEERNFIRNGEVNLKEITDKFKQYIRNIFLRTTLPSELQYNDMTLHQKATGVSGYLKSYLIDNAKVLYQRGRKNYQRPVNDAKNRCAGGEPEEIFNAAEIYRQTKEYSPPESLQTTQFGSGRSQSLHKRKLEGKASDVTSSVRSPESSSKRIPFSEYVLSTQSKDASKIELPSDTIESTTSIVTSPATQMKSATTSGTKDVATTSSVVSSTSQTKPLTGIETALSWENRSSQIASECLATKKQADDACIQIRNGFRYSLGKAIPEIDKLAQDISVFESRAVKGKYRIVVPTSILTEARKPGALVSLTETCKSAIVASESRFSSWDSLVVPSDLFARSIKALEKRRAFLTTLQSLNTLGQ